MLDEEGSSVKEALTSSQKPMLGKGQARIFGRKNKRMVSNAMSGDETKTSAAVGSSTMPTSPNATSSLPTWRNPGNSSTASLPKGNVIVPTKCPVQVGHLTTDSSVESKFFRASRNYNEQHSELDDNLADLGKICQKTLRTDSGISAGLTPATTKNAEDSFKR